LSNARGEQCFVVGQNRGPIQVFKPSRAAARLISYGEKDAFAVVKMANGKTKRYELYQGHTFLSQSTRKLWLPANAVEVGITDFQGKTRVEKLKK